MACLTAPATTTSIGGRTLTPVASTAKVRPAKPEKISRKNLRRQAQGGGWRGTSTQESQGCRLGSSESSTVDCSDSREIGTLGPSLTTIDDKQTGLACAADRAPDGGEGKSGGDDPANDRELTCGPRQGRLAVTGSDSCAGTKLESGGRAESAQ